MWLTSSMQSVFNTVSRALMQELMKCKCGCHSSGFTGSAHGVLLKDVFIRIASDLK
jgi:hypothetical protein